MIDKMRNECALQIHLNRACRKIMRSKRWSGKFCDKVIRERLDEKQQVQLTYQMADFIERKGEKNMEVFVEDNPQYQSCKQHIRDASSSPDLFDSYKGEATKSNGFTDGLTADMASTQHQSDYPDQKKKSIRTLMPL